MRPFRKEEWLVALAVAVGFLQALGFVTGWAGLRNLGLVTAAAPLPLVFSDVEGLETFATTVDLTGYDPPGLPCRLRVSPADYARVQGAFNFRNPVTLAIAHGPRLPEALRDGCLRFAFCGAGRPARDLGLPPHPDSVRVTLTPRNPARSATFSFCVVCP